MPELLTINGVQAYIDENGTAQLNLEDVARGLGFTTVATSGNECVRWQRVFDYLKSFGTCVENEVNVPEFIPENIFYRLAMKAKNETAEKFQAIVADEILPAIRKTGAYSAPQMTQIQIIAAIAQAAADQEKQLKQISAMQEKQANELQGIRDVVALNSTGWREDSKRLITKMAEKLGGFEHIQAVRKESYKQLNARINVDIDRRVLNKRQRMALEGVCKSKCDKVNYLDIIADDKKLLETYLAIVKEMAIKAGVA